MSSSDDYPASADIVACSTERLGASADGTWERLAILGVAKYNSRIDAILDCRRELPSCKVSYLSTLAVRMNSINNLK
jgi:hypothetical protein